MNIVITGRPGVGKSTLFMHVINKLREKGFIVYGFRTPEVRDGGVRLGFKIVDLSTGEESWLAKKGFNSQVRVGSYGILVEEASALIEKSMRTAIEANGIIGIDEVGPMELKIPVFKPLLLKVLTKNTVKILVVHERISDSEVLSELNNGKWFNVTVSNRDSLRDKVFEEVYTSLKRVKI